MFSFAIDIKDASEVSRAELIRAGIIEDSGFRQRIIDAFKAEHPDWSVESSESSFALKELEMNDVFFTASDVSPNSFEEALRYLTKALFFPPLFLWLNGEKMDVANVVMDSFFRIVG